MFGIRSDNDSKSDSSNSSSDEEDSQSASSSGGSDSSSSFDSDDEEQWAQSIDRLYQMLLQKVLQIDWDNFGNSGLLLANSRKSWETHFSR